MQIKLLSVDSAHCNRTLTLLSMVLMQRNHLVVTEFAKCETQCTVNLQRIIVTLVIFKRISI